MIDTYLIIDEYGTVMQHQGDLTPDIIDAFLDGYIDQILKVSDPGAILYLVSAPPLVWNHLSSYPPTV